MKILVLNGPNLNLLGLREESIYGSDSLSDVEDKLKEIANKSNCEIGFYQSNAEHELIDAIHNAYRDKTDAIIFNPAGYTHTSVALRDALLAVKIPFLEVHISDIESREEFRQKSYFTDIAEKTISGKGTKGYEMALDEALNIKG
ncbi:MAG: type II 3-dehydroquinate dehydratase [Gammaproteobacteria bacterium]|jgi:3-dehydroquinate dehydratase-2|tara:strand:+ start:441 stop:875 length:435 start_codon:yes stop_codon:yes gene_type:complete